MNNEKIRIMNRNSIYLLTIYNFGKGVLLLSQLEWYLWNIECIPKYEVKKQLELMYGFGIIDYLPDNMIKIKKTAHAFLFDKMCSQVKSISITERLLALSYLKNALIQKNKISSKSINDLNLYLSRYTTLLCSEVNAHEILKLSDSKTAYQEYQINERYKEELFKSKKDATEQNTINMRKLIKRRIYLSLSKKGYINVFYLHISKKFSYKKLVKWFMETEEYLNECFPDRISEYYLVTNGDFAKEEKKIKYRFLKEIAKNSCSNSININIYNV